MKKNLFILKTADGADRWNPVAELSSTTGSNNSFGSAVDLVNNN